MGRRVIKASDFNRQQTTTFESDVNVNRSAFGPAMEMDVHREALDPSMAPAASTAHQPAVEIDDFTTKLIKYIPSEIVAAYITMNGMVEGNPSLPEMISWLIFIALFIITPLYIWRVTTAPGESVPYKQILISTIAFFIWVFAIGGPFEQLDWYNAVYGALLLPIYTLMMPILDR